MLRVGPEQVTGGPEYRRESVDSAAKFPIPGLVREIGGFLACLRSDGLVETIGLRDASLQPPYRRRCCREPSLAESCLRAQDPPS